MAIQQTLGCEAGHTAQCIDVHVSRRNGEDWSGTVHEFEISGHPRASR
jgi:hypothetical protein